MYSMHACSLVPENESLGTRLACMQHVHFKLSIITRDKLTMNILWEGYRAKFAECAHDRSDNTCNRYAKIYYTIKSTNKQTNRQNITLRKGLIT